MAGQLKDQISSLRRSIEGLEAQRGTLGDEILDPALGTLRQQLAALEAQAAKDAMPIEERRLVTILFIDMVGSTSRAEKLDPEEWRQVVSRFHSALTASISAHRGEVAQYLGDGLLAFFGAKEASEDDPENAIRAALDGQVAVTNELGAENVQMRAGVHSGLVVVGELGGEAHKEFTASGDAVNLAARLQSAAPPSGILISHDTYRYVRGVFDMTPRPPLTVKGKSEPLQTYLVRRAKPRPFRRAARGVAGVETRTIGRESETKALQAAYLRAYEGHGTVWAQLVSEPGVGKSRLVSDLGDWMDLREENYRLMRARAFPDDADQPFALVRRLWFDRFQIAEDIPLAQAEAKWAERFHEFQGLDDSEEAAHALGLLVGLSFADSPHVRGMRNDPRQVKGRAMVVSKELLRAVRREYPIVLLLEDMQWMDAASWEYLMEVFLADATEEPSNGLFILGAARPEWCPPPQLTELFKSSPTAESGCKSWGTMIPLAPLTDEATRELAHELLQRAVDIPEQIIDLLVQRSEGVPYFAEELVNWFIDHGIVETRGERWHIQLERLKEEPLPATLQHLLLTRLSSLSQPERDALQRGAIFGRRFWTGGLEALGVPAGAETLGHLQPRGFVEAQPESTFRGDTEWSFHQNLLQEVTYESVLKRERAALHKVAAIWLERQARDAGRLEEFAGLLGDHFERSGDLSAAADWYMRAGRRAMGQGAPREAKAYFTRALNLLPPVDRERRWQALLDREDALSVLSEPEARRLDIAALLGLARSCDDDGKLAEAYLRQAVYGMQAGEVPIIEEAVRESLVAARRCGNEAIEARALSVISAVDLNRNDRVAAISNIERSLELARQLEDDNVLAFVLYRAAWGYGELGDFARCDGLYNEQIELDHRLGNRSQEATGLGNLGAQYLSMGLFKQGRSTIEKSRAIKEGLGARRGLAYDLINLANIGRATGDLRKARQLGEQALHEIAPTNDARGQSGILAELGLTLLEMGDLAGAARRFTEARELALTQGLAARVAEATCLLGACALLEGNLEQARLQVKEGWDYLREGGWAGMSNPGMVYLSCAEVFDGLGEEQDLRSVLEVAHQELLNVAGKINVPAWRQSFMENVPEHRSLMQMWERKKA